MAYVRKRTLRGSVFSLLRQTLNQVAHTNICCERAAYAPLKTALSAIRANTCDGRYDGELRLPHDRARLKKNANP
ncbi:hypothetical protein BvRS1_02560 [Burkholderia vietnamiensis]|nr:hypothetical protein BvRS1_02560 [Burkholderia vietnamiensis]